MRAIIAAASLVLLLAVAGARAATPLIQGDGVNRGVVELETLGADGGSAQIGQDLANLVDDGATRRVLPIVGRGSLQNLIDLRTLRGIDMAILQVDVLDYVKQQQMFPGIEHSLTYIAKLYNEEFHLLARADIKTVADLANQRVNVDVPGAGSGITAQRLFELLKIPVTLTNDDEGTGLAKLRRGDIAALAFVAAKPAPLFSRLDGKDGLHLLSIPLTPEVTAAFVPTRLTANDYPGLVPPDHPVDTVAVGTVLAAANIINPSQRYRNLVNFVDAFFTGFHTLTEPGHHAKWREVNLAAEVPGLRRFPPAAEWLQRNAPVANAVSPQDLKAMFMRFIDERQQASGGGAMSQQQKDELFGQFEKWQSGQSH